MPHLGIGHVVNAPRIGHPVACGNGLHPRILHGNMGNMPADIVRGLPCLLLRTGTAVDGRIDAPYGGTLMQSAQPHAVLKLSPDTLVLHPQATVHGLQDSVGLLPVRLSILTDYLGNAGGQPVASIVIGRRMGHCPATVVERIAGPDAAVGIVEMVAVGVEVTFLPDQMTLDDGPHPAHVGRVGIILEVPEQLVHIVQVHVVVVHLVVALRITADVAVAVHLRAPLLLSPGHVHLRVLRRMGNRGGHIGHLTLRVGIEVAHGTVVPSQHVACVGRTPAC